MPGVSLAEGVAADCATSAVTSTAVETHLTLEQLSGHQALPGGTAAAAVAFPEGVAVPREPVPDSRRRGLAAEGVAEHARLHPRARGTSNVLVAVEPGAGEARERRERRERDGEAENSALADHAAMSFREEVPARMPRVFVCSSVVGDPSAIRRPPNGGLERAIRNRGPGRAAEAQAPPPGRAAQPLRDSPAATQVRPSSSRSGRCGRPTRRERSSRRRPRA